MTRGDALRIFAATLDRAFKGPHGRRIDHIGHPRPYADIIATWLRAREFLDSEGNPRRLTFRGSRGFTALVRSAHKRVNPKAVLMVFMRYGNVRRTKAGRYELVKPFFDTSNPTTMAYEPLAYFLSDASSTLGRILRRAKHSGGPQLFWQKTENASITESAAKRFNAFAKERSLVFLDELDDWLEAHSRRTKVATRAHRRVGLGIFSIYSDPEASDR